MIERKLAALCVRNIFPSVGGMTLCLIRHIVRGRGLVVEVAVRTCKALCLFGIGVFEERLTLAAHRAVLAGNFVEEIFLQVGIGSQPATRFPERGRAQTRLVDLAAVTIDGLAVFVMYELNKHYGWSKFIVVVPSIAIREGVYKSFQVTQEHFAEEYGKKIRFFIYNSSQLTEIDRFASDSSINVMIINIL